ncbi:MAG: TolC family protein [Gemmatimonadetes bacterium]|nr:TolC family protein [Gemmatimonadota bacterium]
MASTLPLLVALALPLRAQQAPGDSLLSAFLTAVREESPLLAAARAEVAAAEGARRAAGPSPAPTLSAAVEEVPDGVDLPHAGMLRLDLQRPFFTGGVRGADRAAAGVRVELATARLALLERGLRASVERDLLRWRGWRAIAARLAAEDTLLLDAEAALRARFTAGEARYVDVLRIRTERLRVQTDRAAALRSAQAGRRRLEALSPDAGPARATLDALLAGAGTDAPDLPPAPSVDSLIASAGQLQLLDLAVRAARADSAYTAATRRPQVMGGVGLQRFGDEAGGFQVGPALTASVSLPFAVRGSTRAQAAASGLAIRVAEARRAAEVVRLRTALLLARDRYDAARTQAEVYDAALLTGAREEREAALASFRAGELPLIELLDFERALAQAETSRRRAAMDATAAWADLLTTLAGAPDLLGAADPETAHD